VLDGEHVEEERHRYGGQQHRPSDVGSDHDAALVRVPVDPGAGEHREQQIGDEGGGDQVAHLGGAGL
jgi:hypothetical protein